MPPKNLKKKKKATTKVVKKKWVKIHAPKIFNETVLGETHVVTDDKVMGKTITINMMGLLRDPKKQNISVTFKVNQMKNEGAMTVPTKLSLSPVSMKRLVKRGRNKVADSFKCKGNEGLLIVKPFLVTRGLAPNATQTALRKKTRELVTQYLAKHPFERVIQELVQGRFQREMLGPLRKIFPVQVAEIRVIQRAEEVQQKAPKVEQEMTQKPAEIA